AASAAFIASTTNVSAKLDGRPAEVFHVISEVFSVAMPEVNIFDDPCASVGGVPAGVYAPAVDEGLYVAINPLPAGQHEIHIRAKNPSQRFSLDVTYHLTVAPVRRN